MVAAALVVLGNPGLVAFGLAGFLARGGIVALALPIVVLPTPAGLANVFAPAIVPVYFGTPSPLVTLFVGIGAGVLAAWLVVGGFVGAWADAVLVATTTADEEMAAADVTGRSGWAQVGRIFLVRLVAHAPLAVILSWGATRIYQVTYRELTSPFEVVTPLVVRIVSQVPDAIAVVAVVWVLGEAAGGMAARHVLLGRRSVAASLALGWLELVRRPRTSLATLVATDLLVLGSILFTFAASIVAWSIVESLAFNDASWLLMLPAVLSLVGAWLAGVLLTGAAVTHRSAAWTAECLRRRAIALRGDRLAPRQAVGTIGSGDETPPGEWSSARPSGSL